MRGLRMLGLLQSSAGFSYTLIKVICVLGMEAEFVISTSNLNYSAQVTLNALFSRVGSSPD